MRKLRSLIMRFGGLFNKSRKDQELHEELESHIQMHTEDNLRSGMMPEEARRQAMIKMGGIESTKEACREQRGLPLVETLCQDVRFGLRMLRKSPGFTVIAIFTLALGIGANIAIFSLIDSVLLEPLPYPHSEQLVMVLEILPDASYNAVSGGAFKDWREHNTSFEHLAIFEGTDMNLTGGGMPMRVRGMKVSSEYLAVLGVVPELGRGFAQGEDSVGGENRVMLLTHAYWKSRYGGDTNIIGRLVSLDQVSYTIIGILPPKALTEDKAMFLIPEVIDAPSTDWSRSGHFRAVIGRLHIGVTMAQAQVELRDIKRQLNSLYPPFKKDWSVLVLNLKEVHVGGVRPSLILLLGTAGLVLLIACANVSNLLLARGNARGREMAIRIALGARSWRMVRQLLTETLLLAVAGCAAGLLLAVGGIKLLTGMVAGMIPQLLEPEINFHVLFFSALAACACTLLSGILPALRVGGGDVSSVLKDSDRGSTSASGRRSQSLLVAAEYTFTLVLLIGAGLFLHSFVHLLETDPGFNPRRTLTFDLSFPDAKYPKGGDRLRFINSVKERLEKLPGVESVGACSSLPLGSANETEYASRGDGPPLTDYIVGCNFVSADYFSAMGMRLQRGRAITAADGVSGAPRVLVVDDTLERHLYPGEDAVGKSLHLLGQDWQIVGVVAPVRHFAMDREPQAIVYGAESFSPTSASIVIRTTLPILSLAQTARNEILKLDHDQPIANVRTLDQAVHESLSSKRAIMILLGVFATVAIGLACVGIYGVTAHAVGQRTREFRIRSILGAQRADIIHLVLKGGVKPSVLGIAVGLLAATAMARLIQSQLFEVKAYDPLVFVCAIALLVFVAALSIYIPARRAANADSMVALRHE